MFREINFAYNETYTKGSEVIRKNQPSGLEDAMNEIYSEMKGFTADSDEYCKMTDQLLKLHSMQTVDRSHRVSPDTIATISANVIGIALILHYERIHVVTSRALTFVMKLR